MLSCSIRLVVFNSYIFIWYFYHVLLFSFPFVFQAIEKTFKDAYPQGVYRLVTYLPHLVVRFRRGSTGFPRTYNFVEAIQELQPISSSGLSMLDSEFEKAYQAAGQKFKGQLEELFLVLSDSSPLASENAPRGAAGGNVGAGPKVPAGARSQKRAQPDDVDIDMTDTSSKSSRVGSVTGHMSRL